jgi:hypothetical protein
MSLDEEAVSYLRLHVMLVRGDHNSQIANRRLSNGIDSPADAET